MRQVNTVTVHPPSCGPRQLLLPLEGFQKKRFIDLDNVLLPEGLVVADLTQKPVTPEECGVLADAAYPGGITNGKSINQRLCVAYLAVTFVQPCKRSSCQCITGFVAL